MQPNVQKCTTTTLPRRPASFSGEQLIQVLTVLNSGALAPTRTTRSRSNGLPTSADNVACCSSESIPWIVCESACWDLADGKRPLSRPSCSLDNFNCLDSSGESNAL